MICVLQIPRPESFEKKSTCIFLSQDLNQRPSPTSRCLSTRPIVARDCVPKCKRMKNTTLYISSCPSNGSLQRVVVSSLFQRGFTPGKHKNLQNSVKKSERPLKTELSFIWLFKECPFTLLHLESVFHSFTFRDAVSRYYRSCGKTSARR